MRFTPEAVAILAVLAVAAIWGGLKLFRSLQAMRAAASAVDSPDLLQTNPRLAQLLRVVGELRQTLIWIGLGLVGWIIFMYLALQTIPH